jgi:hypothetical protein
LPNFRPRFAWGEPCDKLLSFASSSSFARKKLSADCELHHKLPLDDGGTNATSNLILIRIDPDHQLITQYQFQQTREMSAGQTRKLEWPMPDSRLRIWPKTPDDGAYPTVHKLEWPMPDSRVRIWPKVPDRGPYSHLALTGRGGMPDVDNLLAVIDGQERKFRRTIRPPASPEAIERLRRFARDSLGPDLPESYDVLWQERRARLQQLFDLRRDRTKEAIRAWFCLNK